LYIPINAATITQKGVQTLRGMLQIVCRGLKNVLGWLLVQQPQKMKTRF